MKLESVSSQMIISNIFENMSKIKIKNFLDKFCEHIYESGLIQCNQHVLIAVSGGMDSMFLLYMLSKIKEKLGISITVGHINHQLRTEAKKYENFVQKVCEKYNFHFITKTLDPNSILREQSIEEWARVQRYEKLESIRKEIDADIIVTGHHGNDQIETLLMRMGNGTGVKGLQGIHEIRGCIVRPLLHFSRKEISAFVKANNIQFINDISNEDDSIKRNAIRHQVIPNWEQINPNLNSAFDKMHDYSKENDELVRYTVKLVSKKLVQLDSYGNKKILKEDFDILPILLRMNVVHEIIGETHLSWRRFQYEGLKKFLIQSRTGQSLSLPMNWRILRDRNNFLLRKDQKVQKLSHKVQPADITDCGNFYFAWEWVNDFSYSDNTQWMETIDGGKIKNQNLEIRRWKPGDSFVPFGMKNHKKVSDYLIDSKLNNFSKENQFVLTANNNIIWLCGYRISDRVKVTSKTTDFAQISITQKN